jgi:predicted RNA-binding protein with PUA-like domain
MGDGMVALCMNSWDGVDDYQCQDFMHAVLRWLLQ